MSYKHQPRYLFCITPYKMLRNFILTCFSVFYFSIVSNGLADTGVSTDKPIRVLIVDGFSNHDWRHTSEVALALLLDSGFSEVAVETAPPSDSPEFDEWDPQFSNYDVVVQICNDLGGRGAWSEQVKSDFESFVQSGGGLYIFHGANNSFSNWPEYDKMIGMGWRGVEQGESLEIIDGQRVRIPRGTGKKTNHGARTDMVVQTLESHPITAGYPDSWKTPNVELYQYPRGPVENLAVLSYGYHEESGREWPMEWTVAYGKGRVYNGTFGHVWKNEREPIGVRCVGWQTTFLRSVQWLAGRVVTYPIPDDFPNESKVSLRDLSLSYRLSEGWESLFNGKDLEGWSAESSAKENVWTVEDGVIVGLVGPENESSLTSERVFSDFQVRLKFQVSSSRESRTSVVIQQTETGVEVVIDRSSESTADLKRSKEGAWRQLELVCEGDLLKTYLNGRLVSTTDKKETVGFITLKVLSDDAAPFRFSDIWVRSFSEADQNRAALLETIAEFESAWAHGDFLKVESFFAHDAKRLHTEPYVWDRSEISRYFAERNETQAKPERGPLKGAWKNGRDYLEIRVDGNLGYDVFTTDRFKALHIWEKQTDGSWKIIYDMGMLNYPEKG